MPAAESRWGRRFHRVLPFLLLVLGSAQFALHYIWAGVPFLGLQLYTRQAIPMPYQGRILVAWLFSATAGRPHFYNTLTHWGAHLPQPVRDPYMLVLLVLVFVSLLAAALACRATVYRLCGNRTFSDWSVLLLLGLALYMTFFEGYEVMLLPYDIPSIALFSIGIWLVLADRMFLLLAVFVLGTLNRETYIFITVFALLYACFRSYGIAGSPLPGLRRVAPFVVLQVTFWCALHLWLVHHFAANLGPSDPRRGFVLQTSSNLHSLLNPMQWPLLATSLAPLVLPLALGWRWVQDKAFAQASAWIIALWFAGMFFVGVLVEVRIFNELISFAAPCIASIVWSRLLRSGNTHLRAGTVVNG